MKDDEIYQKRDILLAEIHSDIKNLVKNFEAHLKDDKENFDKLQKKVDWQEKVIYMGLGAVALIEIGAKLIR